jgi:hypothetical protein
MSQTSKLMKDLSYVPHVVGGLGLSIAAAQKAFNADYLENVEKILAYAKALHGGKVRNAAGDPVDMSADQKKNFEEFRSFLKEMLAALAPPRYQYTETTLSVKLDLAQSLDFGATVGLGLGFGGVSLNAAFTIGYGYDYRAAAECKTVIHAIPADPVTFNKLLERAATINDKALTLPDKHPIDDTMIETSERIFEKLVGEGAKPPAIEKS